MSNSLNLQFLFSDKLPKGFKFPSSFIDFIKNNQSVDLTPWWFFHTREGAFDIWLEDIRNQYPKRQLVPFAMVNYSDDIACFDASIESTDDPIVFYVHVFASPGWEDRGSVPNFNEWLEQALQEAQEYQSAE